MSVEIALAYGRLGALHKLADHQRGKWYHDWIECLHLRKLILSCCILLSLETELEARFEQLCSQQTDSCQ